METTANYRPTRRGKKRVAAQKVDPRQAFNGSDPIPHDAVMYSSSGWTQFTVDHPLNRANPGDATAVNAILATDVGGADFQDEQGRLTRLEELVGLMGKNHRRFRYGAILGRILDSASEYDPLKSCVDVDRVVQFVRRAVKSVIPLELLGGRENLLVFLSNVRSFIQAGRKTCFTLNGLMQSMKTNRCNWLAHLESLPLQVSLLARLVKWVNYILSFILFDFCN